MLNNFSQSLLYFLHLLLRLPLSYFLAQISNKQAPIHQRFRRIVMINVKSDRWFSSSYLYFQNQ